MTGSEIFRVGEFIESVSKNEEEIEANLYTVFQKCVVQTVLILNVVAKFSAW